MNSSTVVVDTFDLCYSLQLFPSFSYGIPQTGNGIDSCSKASELAALETSSQFYIHHCHTYNKNKNYLEKLKELFNIYYVNI